MTFILDHLGHLVLGVPGIKNYPFETWKKDITDLAAQGNVVAKLGDIEEWDVADPQPYLQHALKTFGFERCLYESNWFVNKAMGDMYDKTFLATLKACQELGATEEQLEMVFRGNAARVYSLNK